MIRNINICNQVPCSFIILFRNFKKINKKLILTFNKLN